MQGGVFLKLIRRSQSVDIRLKKRVRLDDSSSDVEEVKSVATRSHLKKYEQVKQKMLDEMLIHIQAFNLCDSVLFREFVETLDPKWKMPNT